MEKIGYSFFIDFDGTITDMDVCAELVTTFAGDGWREINDRWEQKELSTVECARQTFQLFSTHNAEDLQKVADQAVVDPAFGDFLYYCRVKDFPVTILSDGYDFYIKHLLKREGLEVPFYSNQLLFTPRLDIAADHNSDECDLCGVCKLELLRKLAPPACKTVYIGDGYSDFCPARHADIVFAKKTLYKYCLEEEIPVHYFAGFQDILDHLAAISKEASK